MTTTKLDPLTTTTIDNWRQAPTSEITIDLPWIGRTIFRDQVSYPQIYEHDATDEARPAKGGTTPKGRTLEGARVTQAYPSALSHLVQDLSQNQSQTYTSQAGV